ncbi:gamma-glutamyltransferase [Bordetella avium]|uniref:Acylase [includes: cephalosporin acylase gamma-glutamyltranspeptidase] n=1 Tax=Bordetella avium (strain 197N) TaxID=360910 RepID=Q2KXJ4_BORA1|nr:gamma-glutamyltransferase [Bordetella avium]AZY53188.1 gamma-glutamyltransferase [Bordetella avium]RIQ12466.1 gamma-glutamyltransferase [Bordetella avium]RIQ17557.1 gamma-glutamyltransferase [Bordetella avium]RIQ32214.1 gamma-glutamyltransferase [Bordetella avium]RIQ37296.1 gamma-glutamyltransferase [Bordetella avium]
MRDNFSNTQLTRKIVLRSADGVVASQHRKAAEAGAAILAAGGDAVDAAVATSFAAGVAEPWMSGPMGGGAMVIYRADTQKAHVVHFGMRSPAALDPTDYPLASDGRVSADLFPWPAVIDDRNCRGATAVAVPGTVAGMAAAHKAYGRLPWRDTLQDAIALAEEGPLIDWYTTLMIAGSARWLARDPDAAALFLDDGCWPKASGWTATAGARLNFQQAAQTLRQLAEEGAQALYGGDIGRALARDIQAKGGRLSLADLQTYEAQWLEPLAIPYRGGTVYATPQMTAGPNLARCLHRLENVLRPEGRPGSAAFEAYAQVLLDEYQWRLQHMGDNEDPRAPACTTHFSVVDRQGNMCSVTQTLLSAFGSHIVSPSTGMLLNNGIMWFDPEPGKPNSLAPDKRCLMNICPVIGSTDGRRFAIGASGGRKILPAVLQLTSFLMDYGMSLEEAFHHPRIDASTGSLIIDPALGELSVAALAGRFPHELARRGVYPFAYACPAGVQHDAGGNQGCTEIMSPWGDTALAEHQRR